MDGWYPKVRIGKWRVLALVLVTLGVRAMDSPWCSTSAWPHGTRTDQRRVSPPNENAGESVRTILFLLFGLLRSGHVKRRKIDG